MTEILIGLVVAIVGLLLTELLRPKTRIEDERASGLGDFNFPTATEGRFVPVGFGRFVVEAPNVTWYGDLFPEPITKYIRSSMFSGRRTILGFKYHVGIHLVLCRGLIDQTAYAPGHAAPYKGGLLGFWVGEKLVPLTQGFQNISSPDMQQQYFVNEPDFFGGNDVGSGGLRMILDLHHGAPNIDGATLIQCTNQYLVNVTGGFSDPDTPRYIDTCYVVARRYHLDQYLAGFDIPAGPGGAYVGNSASLRPWKFEVARYSPAMPGQPAGQHKVGVDTNPVNAVYEALRDTNWGEGTLDADIEVGASGSFVTCATTLFNEGNGFGFLLGSPMDLADFISEVERQIAGRFYLNPRTGKWACKLARADYDPNTIDLIDESNIIEVRDFKRGSWMNTINQVDVEFNNRANEYKVSYARAHDAANMQMQGGGSLGTMRVVPGRKKYPGVKDPDNANNIAWRDLRSQSRPLAMATFVLDRSFWDLVPMTVLAWTSEQYGFTRLPMRVLEIEEESPKKRTLLVKCVEDVFAYAQPSFAPPTATGWVPPSATLVAYPAADQLAFEMPRAVLVRDPDFQGDDTIARITVAARQQGLEAGYRIMQRNAVGTPSGAYANASDVLGYIQIGKLLSALNAGVATPTGSIQVVPDPSAQTSIEDAFSDGLTPSELGNELAHLIMVGTEFMLVRSVVLLGGNVNFQNVYRGALDTGQQSHAANAPVYLLFAGSGATSTIFANTNNVDIELRQIRGDEVFAGAVTTIAIALSKRVLRPYPAAALLYNASSTPYTTPSLEALGGPGLNGFRLDVTWWRRRYDTGDEVAEMLSDHTDVDPSTEYQLTMRADPLGVNALVLTSSWVTGAGALAVSRNAVIGAAPAGTLLRLTLRTRHDIGTEVDLESRNDARHDVTPTSALTGKSYLGGALGTNVASNDYASAGTAFRVNIGVAYSSGSVEYDINHSGVWTVVVAALAATGTFAALPSDIIRLRRTAVSGGAAPNFVELRDETGASTVVAYGKFA